MKRHAYTSALWLVHLDWVVIRRVGRQVDQLAAPLLDELHHAHRRQSRILASTPATLSPDIRCSSEKRNYANFRGKRLSGLD